MSTIDNTGLTIETLEETKQKQINAYKNIWGDSLYVGDDDDLGKIAIHYANEHRNILEIIQFLTEQFDINKATGVNLDNLVSILNIKRQTDTFSTAPVELVGTSGVTVQAGSLITNSDGLYQWALDEAVVLSGGVDIGSVTCTTAGPIEAASGTLTVIVNNVAGWTSVENSDDATVGAVKQNDAELKQSYLSILDAPLGSSSLPNIRAQILEVDGVSECNIYENTTKNTDIYGLPPGYVWVVVRAESSALQDVAETMFNFLPAGTSTYFYTPSTGSTTKTVTFSGQNFDLNLTNGEQEDYYLTVNIETNTTNSSSDSDIKTALANYIDGLPLGGEIVYTKLINTIYQVDTGITNVTNLKIDTSSVPSGTSDIIVDRYKFANLPDGNITITNIS